MPEDVPVRTCINVMVGITRSKVIVYFCYFLSTSTRQQAIEVEINQCILKHQWCFQTCGHSVGKISLAMTNIVSGTGGPTTNQKTLSGSATNSMAPSCAAHGYCHTCPARGPAPRGQAPASAAVVGLGACGTCRACGVQPQRSTGSSVR